MTPCEHLKDAVIERGLAAVQGDPEYAAHLEQCPRCRDLLAAYQAVPDLLAESLEVPPAKVVTRTLDAVSAVEDPSGTGRRRLSATLGTVMVALAAIALFPLVIEESSQIAGDLAPSPQSAPSSVQSRIADPQGPEIPKSEEAPSKDDNLFADVLEPEPVAEQEAGGGSLAGATREGADEDSLDRLVISGSRIKRADIEAATPVFRDRREEDTGAYRQRAMVPESQTERPASGAPEDGTLNESLASADESGRLGDQRKGRGDLRGTLGADQDGEERANRPARRSADKPAAPPAPGVAGLKEKKNATGSTRPAVPTPESFEFGQSVVNGTFSAYERREALVFQEPTGYWANTHVPGDPEIRLLNARLKDWQRSEELDKAVAPHRQPFDPPKDNALSLSLMADRQAVEGPSRVRLQVGLQAIEHRRGQRPAMNLAVVLDLPVDAEDEQRIQARSLLDALMAARQSGDRFSVVFSGIAGGLAVAPDQFRHGTLQQAKGRIIDPAIVGETVALPQALELARQVVGVQDDPSRPLGSSAILLVSAGTLEVIDTLEAQAHRHAVDGITLSVVPLGSRAAPERVDRLVLAGLGQRRALAAADQARALVEEELHAASRAVARSARLSIRLAPGVRLIDVLGSRRLDSERAQQVREIEQSMDQRLSRRLGIIQDRGQDEDGIQIVVPGIHGGDSVVILLDLLVEGPGDVAEVTLRYKDLVFLRNGALRGQISLPRGAPERGPAGLLVTKNLLAFHFTQAVRRAAEMLGQGQPEAAADSLQAMIELLQQARGTFPAWVHDADLINDQRVLEAYLRALSSPQAHLGRLGDSLRLAAWRRSHRPPEDWNP